MLNPSPQILRLLSPFAKVFTTPTFQKAVLLICGTILAPGRRTVSAALRMVGLANDSNYSKYHRVLNRDVWSPLYASRLLSDLLIALFLRADDPILVGVDETLEQRRGKCLSLRGWYRDPVASSWSYTQKVSALRWLCVSLLVPVPWSNRRWSLPIMMLPAPSQQVCERLEKRHRAPVELAGLVLRLLRRWYPQRQLEAVGDGSYASIELIAQAQQAQVTLVSRLRFNARLYDLPETAPPGKRGPKPQKGKPQPSFTERLNNPKTRWQQLTVSWYGGHKRTVEVTCGSSLWHKTGFAPVLLHWVLLRCPDDRLEPAVYFSSAPQAATETLQRYIWRWNMEVTFEEAAAHLGFGTQRSWADKTICRSTPCLMGLFSLIVALAKRLYPEQLPVRQASWYAKQEASFGDALAAVRQHLWSQENYLHSTSEPDLRLIPAPLLEALLETACYST